MYNAVESQSFETINTGFNSVFKPGRLSIGLVVPIEQYDTSPVPKMENQLARIQQAETLGFSAVWIRDVPFNVPTFGDAGQVFDPFVYLGLLTARTSTIALGVASIILPLRHPAHVAKAAASVDGLSGGRLILGVASGDRPDEYPAMAMTYSDRGKRFRDSFNYIRHMANKFPTAEYDQGQFSNGMDLLPKPFGAKLPMLVTGGSQQDTNWIAGNSDGWMIYPRPAVHQSTIIQDWRQHTYSQNLSKKPVMQPLYIDLAEDPAARPMPIHLGLRLGTDCLVEHLSNLEAVGVNHVALNLRFNKVDIKDTLERMATDVLPRFHH